MAGANNEAFKNSMAAYIGKIQKAVDEASNKNVLQAVGTEAIKIIVKRTRLGYGVAENLGVKERLKSMRPHSESYQLWRKKNRGKLSPMTTPTRQNLTMSGDMLNNMTLRVSQKSVFISTQFADRAAYQADAGRVFNRLSELEVKQLRLFFMRNFKDLLKLNNLS